MSCVDNNCNCNFSIKNYGTSDLSRISLIGKDRTTLNWSEISVPEILSIPELKPDIESIDQVYVTSSINSIKLIETPFAYETYRTYYITILELSMVQALANTISTEFPSQAISTIATNINSLVGIVNGIIGDDPDPTLQPIVAILSQLSAIATTLPPDAANVSAAAAKIIELKTPGSVCAVVSLLEDLYNAINLVDADLENAFSLLNQLVVLSHELLDSTSSDTIDAAVAPILVDITTVRATLSQELTSVTNMITELKEPNFLVLIRNAEGTYLTGRKLIVNGNLNQKIVYTASVDVQSVHSAHFSVPFSAFIIPYADFEGLVYEENVLVVTDFSTCATTTVSGFPFTPGTELIPNLDEIFAVNVYVEDIFVYPTDPRTIFKNITLFLQAKVAVC